MEINRKALGAARRTRAQEMSAWTADTLDNTPPLSAIQASRLQRQFKVSEAVAQTLAESVFETWRASR